MFFPKTNSLYRTFNQQFSSSCGTFSGASTSMADVTNLSTTITNHGRPVLVSLVPDGSGSASDWLPSSGGAVFQVLRGATVIWLSESYTAQNFTPRIWIWDDFVQANNGTYTYKMQYQNTSGTTTMNYWKLMAWELGT